MRLRSFRSRRENGVNIGGGAGSSVTPACLANQLSTRSMNAGSRSFKLACVTRLLRDIMHIVNCSGCRSR